MTENIETRPPAPICSILEAGETAVDYARRIEIRIAAGLPLGPLTGLPKVDSVIGGYLEPGLHVLHGSPGAGKSALALSIAAWCQCPAIYVSAELSQRVISQRLIARMFGIPMWDVKRMLPQQIKTYVKLIEKKVPSLALLDAKLFDCGIERLREAALTVRESSRTDERDDMLIIIDSGHSWATATYPGVPEYERVNMAISHLELLAAGMDCPIIVISERNRATRDESGQASMKGSGRWEYAAETIFGIDHVKDIPPGYDQTAGIPVELTVSKNRNGITGKVLLNWNGATQTHSMLNDLPEDGPY